jgi:hypothetical protein
MDTVTYPDPRVAQLIQGYFVPFKVNVKQDARLAEQYRVNWTPAVLRVCELIVLWALEECSQRGPTCRSCFFMQLRR